MDPDRYAPGDVILNRWLVLERHRGQLGLVWICRGLDPEPGSPYVAIKTFRFDEALHRSLFAREVRNWLRLPAHPHVVHALEAVPEESLLVLEFVPGVSLKTVAGRRPLHPERFVAWARDVAHGLRFLHVENGFVHRDLRPANVLIDGRSPYPAKITDLGLGKHLDPEAAAHTTIGTLHYMAPEVFEGRMDLRSDLFGLGATLYRLLTGREAYRGSTQAARPVVPPREIDPGIPEAAEALVLRCLARDPDARPASVEEVVAALEDLSPWRPGREDWETCRRHRLPLARDGGPCPFCEREAALEEAERAAERTRKRGGARR